MPVGTVTIGDISVHRLGFGTMRLTGPGIFGPARRPRSGPTTAGLQNGYHVVQRKSEAVLEYCERAGIPFIAYFPLGTGMLAAKGSVLARTAEKIGITPAQAAIAWLLKRSPLPR